MEFSIEFLKDAKKISGTVIKVDLRLSITGLEFGKCLRENVKISGVYHNIEVRANSQTNNY